MENKQIAKEVLVLVGGEENVISLVHCATRLRFKLRDAKKADKAALENHEEVISVVESGGQFQVVIGNHVNLVYKEILAQSAIGERAEEAEDSNGSETILGRFIDLVSGIFTPFLGAMAGAGVLKGFLALATQLNWLAATDGAYRVLMGAADGIFHFLPIFLAATAAKKFKTNQFIAMAIASALVYPDLNGAFFAGEKLTFFGIPIVLMNYASSVIPIILSVYLLSHLEKLVEPKLHSSVRNILTPLICLVVMVPLSFLLIGPVGSYAGIALGNAYEWLYGLSPIVAGVFMGAGWQVFVMFGLHWGFIPIVNINLAANGFDTMTALFAPSVFAQAGASLAVGTKTKDAKLKSLSFSGVITSLFGITEPTVYGVTLKLKKPFIAACIAGGIGGAIAGMGGSRVVAVVMPSILSIPAFAGVGFVYFLISLPVAFIVAFILTYVLGFKDVATQPAAKEVTVTVEETIEPVQAESVIQKTTAVSPLTGTPIPLAEIKDEVFASGALGKGVAIEPTEGKLVSPVAGTVTILFPTLHAVGITAEDGSEYLLHVGMDTVQLEGKYFKAHVKQGDHVVPGQLLTEFDIEGIKSAGYPVTTPVIVTNSADYLDLLITEEKSVTAGDYLLTLVV